jgi:hypothetical protein
MTEDDELFACAQRESLPGGGPLLCAPFLGMGGGHCGLAFSLLGCPRHLLPVLPALAKIIEVVGITTASGERLDHAADADGQVASVSFFDGNSLIGTLTNAPYVLTTQGSASPIGLLVFVSMTFATSHWNFASCIR